MTLNYFNYFTEIEEHFVRKRQRNLLISPLDWCLIELWKENGIPLHVVLRGIDRSFESTAKKRKKSPRTLFYCHPAVMEAFEEYQASVVGASNDVKWEQGDSELSRDEVLKFILNLQSQLERREGEAYERAVMRLSAVHSEINEGSDLNIRQVESDLTEISSMLTESLREDLPDATWKSILATTRKELKLYKRHLAPEMFEQLKQKQLERRLREYFELPEFSLLHCE